jgi:hypothetical protein
MASNIYTRATVDGKVTAYSRKGSQGRKPSGLGKPKLYRLFAKDEEILRLLEIRLGEYYNENEIVREAVHKAVESIYTELLKH